MDQFYIFKTALLTFLITAFFSVSLIAASFPEYCGTASDTILVDSEHGRYTIFIDEQVETLVLEHLEKGADYAIWVSSPEGGEACFFDVSLTAPKLTGIIQDKKRFDFKAEKSTQILYIQNANCSTNESWPADVSISKRKPGKVEEMMNMMGIMTDPNYSAQQLIEEVFIGGGCFEVSNVQPIGNAAGIGYFSNGTSSVNINDGVILASGNIGNSAGPNNVTNITTDFFDTSGDPDLDILASGNVFDAVGIEFDFTPVVDMIQFRYVFASDEYCDYVNTSFNDAFGFFISGPGLAGPYTSGGENIALVPGTGQEVSINTINIQTNSTYYVDNVPVGQPQNAGGCVPQDLNNPGAAEQDIEYDGFTTVLTATANVQVCETYHIRLVIGDVADGIFDSAVFLEANSFDAGGEAAMDFDLPGLDGSGLVYEGCVGDGYIIFERPPDSDLSQPLTVTFNVGPASTATEGVDFSTLPPSITIPAGQFQYLLPFEIFEDFIVEGIETLVLELENPCTCEDASIEIQISDTPPLEVTTPDYTFCFETSTTLIAETNGGLPGYTYVWSNGGSGPAITVDAVTGTQTYTVTVTDDCGQQEISTSTIVVQEQAYATIDGLVQVCEGNPNGILLINFTGQGPWDVIYTIDGVPQAPIFGITENPYVLEVSQVGTYEIISLMVNDCPGISSGSGIVIPTIFVSFMFPDEISCPEAYDGALDFLITGGNPEYTYEWNTTATTEDIDALGPGTYTVTATDQNGCTHVDSYTLEAPDSISTNLVELQGVNCLDSLSGSVDLTVTGGTPDYFYEWDNGSTEEDPVDLSAGLHAVTITDSVGCVTEASVTISEDFDPPLAEAEVMGLLTCDDLEVFINGSNSSGGDSLGFAWLNENGDEIAVDTSINVVEPGSYTLVVTNLLNGCSDETSVTVNQNTSPPTPEASGGLLTCVETTVLLNASGSSGIGSLTYSWLDSNGTEIGTEDTLSVNEEGTYTLIITDTENGCTAETIADVGINEDAPTPEAEPSGVLTCIEETITIDGSGSNGGGTISYVWLNENGDSLGSGPQVDATAPGNYSLIITDSENGCTAETAVQVDQNIEEPVPDAVANGLIDCIQEMVLLDGSGSTSGGNITYQWLDNGTEIGTDPEVEVTTAGTYTLIVTDEGSGCTAETEVIVDENVEAPNPEANASGLLTCDQLMVTLDGSTSSGNGAITYQWLDTNGDPVSTAPDFEVQTPGAYTLIITDAENGCTAETNVTVDEDIEDPLADAGNNGILNCDETAITLDGSNSSSGPNINYIWLNENGDSIGNEITLNVSEAGTYTIMVSNTDNGCSAEAQAIIEIDENVPQPDAVVNGILNCIENEATLDGSGSTANGPLSFQWIDANNNTISDQESTNVTTPGIYTLLITDQDNGCSAQMNVEVAENTIEPQPDILSPEVLTCNTSTVELNASNSSGIGTITYQWLDENGGPIGTNSSIDVSLAGNYTLIITDSENGCTASESVNVEENTAEPVPDAVVDGILNCEVLLLTIDGSGSTGQGALQYQWLDENNAPIGTEVSNEINTPGTYTLIITDAANGCTAETTVNVEQDINDPVAVGTVDDVLSCAINTVQLDGTASSGDHPIDYQWFDSNGDAVSNTALLDVSTAGTYTLVIIDQENGCTSETTVEVDENLEVPVPDANLDGILTCTNQTVLLDGSGSSSSGGLTYQWLDSNNLEIGTEATLDIDFTGIFTLVVTDQLSSCSESISIEVEEDITPPLANAGPGNTLTCDVDMVQLDGSNSSTGSNISYQWVNVGGVTVGNDITVDVGQAGEYTLIVTNTDNGCSATSTTLVVPDENLPTADAGVGSTLTCTVLDATLDGSNSSTGNNISYEWLDSNGVFINNDLEIMVSTPGTYTLIVTDNDNGCSTSASVEVDQNTLPPQADPGNSPLLTCDQTQVMLDGSGSVSSLGNLTYQWLDTNGNPISTDSTVQVDMAGTYTLVVTAENGCTNSAEVEVLLDANVPIADPGDNGILDCNVSVITLGGNNTSSGMDISYQWLNSNNELVGTDPFLDVTTPDTYTLVVLNSANNCETSAQAVVVQDVLTPDVDAGAGGLLTCVETEIILGGSGTSVGDSFQYEWTNANNDVISTDSVHAVSEPGTYTITVFNTENGCQSTEDITISQNIQTPQADAGSGGILTCDITEVTLDGNASSGSNLAYQWLNEAGVSVDSIPQIQVSETGIYTLVVTNTSNGCSSAATVEVVPDENLPVAILADAEMLTCNVSEVLIDASSSTSVSGNMSFEWLDPNADFLSNDPDLLVSVPGVYTIILTDTDNGCTTTALLDVPQDIDLPQVFAGPNDTLTCDITTLQLEGSATNGSNFSFEWFDAANTTVGQNTSIVVTTAGTYTLVVTNLDNGCMSSDQVEVIPDTDLPIAIAGPSGTLTCTTESVILDASASDQGNTIIYEWQNPNGIFISNELQIEVNEPGAYTIFVTNTDNNCVTEDVVVVLEDTNDPLAAIDGIGPIELNCDINAVVLNGENSMPFPTLDFDWSTLDGNISTATDIYEIEVDQPGTYTLLVTNTQNGCTDTQTYLVGENVVPPSAFINAPPTINCYFPEIEINAINTSGSGNFTYSWTASGGSGIVSGANTLDLIVDESGTYILTIENLENGCEETSEVEVVADQQAPDAAANSEDELDCVTSIVEVNSDGSSTGAIYNYTWQGTGIISNPNAAAINVNQSGTYTLIVTNTQNGCVQTTDVFVNENDNVPTALELGVVPPPCPGDPASIQILGVTGGEGPYLYSIDGGASFYDLTLFFGLDPGSYDMVVQDAIGCEYADFVEIPDAQEVFVETELDLEITLGDTVQLNAFVNVPAWTLSSILWTPSASLSCDTCLNPLAFPHETTTYQIMVENENGCPAQDEITLRVRKDRGIYIPNVFTPHNNDGTNDIFYIFSDGKSVKNIQSFQVFDRWGEKVFEDYDFLPDDPAHGWDGRLRNEPMNPAVFVYWARVEFIDGAVILFKGDVTLVR